jgi:ribonuclease BN (tRNA processing enzyme)
MRFTVLGSGSTVPHPKRSSSGYWLSTQGGEIMLDCSATVPHRMAAEGLAWNDLDAIWISHFHMDHCGGLGPLLAGTKHAPAMQNRSKELRIFGGLGLKGLIRRLSDVNDYRLLEQPFPIEIVEVTELQPFEIVPGIEAVAMQTPHTDESHAIHIRDTDETTLMYSADTGFDDKVAAFGRGVDLMIIECSYVKDKTVKKHLELAEAMHLIRKAHPKRAMLTHLYPWWDDVDFQEEVAKFSPPCDVIEAVDGLSIEVVSSS